MLGLQLLNKETSIVVQKAADPTWARNAWNGHGGSLPCVGVLDSPKKEESRLSRGEGPSRLHPGINSLRRARRRPTEG
jgi:hypothetical protein